MNVVEAAIAGWLLAVSAVIAVTLVICALASLGQRTSHLIGRSLARPKNR